ncbi:MAG: 3-deoxy-manno-octulosonate cytidylyltransferase [Pseudoflavonifractor sp.]|nr:3-deoxy-manno-octulosonate cytidylyltransferase [Pseudoflavonifractor sp.]
MRFIGIIPARFASSRFPGKPLADIGGMTMIERVYRQVSKELDTVYVATDNKRIYDTVTGFGGNAVMTSPSHRSGTDRCYEAYLNIGSHADVIINIQGDEPFIDPTQIAAVKGCFDIPGTEIATLVRPFDKALGFEALFDNSKPKVVIDNDDNAIYFSRSIIPYVRNYPWEEWLDHQTFYMHVGMYAYRAATLGRITSLPQSSLELAESLEQLRWIQNGFKIRVGYTDTPTIGIDTPADLERARQLVSRI